MTAQFEDGKEDGALRTIGEVSRATGIKTHVLRYWEQQFPMLEPLKRSGGRRYYRSEDVALIEVIDRLVNEEGYTLKGAQQAIENGKAGPGTEGDAAGPETAPSDASAPADAVADAVPGEPAEAAAESDDKDAPQATAPAAPIIDPNIAPASDGGVDAFFGKQAEPETVETAETVAEEMAEAAEEVIPETVEVSDDTGRGDTAPDEHEEHMSRAEIVERLKQLRDTLAGAIAA